MKLRLSLLLLPAILALACGSTQPSTAPTIAPSLAPTASPSLSPTVVPTPPPVSGPTPSPTDQPSPTPEGATLLLEVTTEGGFIAPSAHLGQLPAVVVDTAGNIYTADPNSAGGSLIALAVVRSVGASGAAQIMAAIKAAGLDHANATGGGPGNPDAGVTVFSVVVDGQEVLNQISGGGAPAPGHPGGSPEPALDLLARLQDPGETWGAANVTTTPFVPTAYKVYDAPATSGGANAIDWPLSASLATFGKPVTPDLGITGLRTGVVFGDDATKLAAVGGSATSDTVFVSDNEQYQVWIRPLLPPELAQ
ncbi:MAG TPA: hypothetical protein VIK08_08945 [Candidatus Limnocylindrales bacterium]